MQSKALLWLLAVLFLMATPSAITQWSHDPAINTPICRADYDQVRPVAISDGAGGAIITWQDTRDAAGIYAQHVNAPGITRWDTGGTAICLAGISESFPAITSDGAGGAIITWQEVSRNKPGFWDIYGGRINAAGNLVWNSQGVAICTTATIKSYPAMTSDSAGGAFIAWENESEQSINSIYAQRVNASGTLLWPDTGVAICTGDGNHYSPIVISDDAGGAIIAWMDSRDGGADVYTQRINSSGTALWLVNGVAIDSAHHLEGTSFGITSDRAGGAIIAWQDYRDGTRDIYAQRINSSGYVLWASNGVLVNQATENGEVAAPAITTDGSGGAIITWQDYRNGTDWNIYAQRIDAGGSVKWPINGVAICSATDDQETPNIMSDSVGGAIVTWIDHRDGTNWAIYSQRINGSGTIKWTTEGVATCTAANSRSSLTIVNDFAQGAIIGWQDGRVNDVSNDIYVQEVDRFGYLGGNTGMLNFGSQWNLLSLPVKPLDSRTRVLFPNAASRTYSFDGTYKQNDTLQFGVGYWLKFTNNDTFWVAGLPIRTDTIAVLEGWNMIGAISVPINIHTIVSNPPGMTTSRFFGYTTTYVSSDTLEPGAGYWVKVSQSGSLLLSAPGSGQATIPAGMIRVVSDDELPPPPPGEGLNAVTIPEPTSFALSQNWPNPFNPATILEYQLPTRSKVILKVYNLVGQTVATVVDEINDAGYRQVKWDASGIASGIYFYRLEATSVENPSKTFIQTKQMVIMK